MHETVATENSSRHPIALLESFSNGAFSRSFAFEGLESVVLARSTNEVIPALRRVEEAVARGRHAAGYVAYEAASGINPELSVRDSGDLPLVWFGIFRERRPCAGEKDGEHGAVQMISQPELEISREEYIREVQAIRACIAAGETYQVNFTTRQRFQVSGDPFTLYRRMCRNQQAPFCAWLDMGTHRILSASPELFFSLEKGRLTMKPMKGTAPRKPLTHEDLLQRELLALNAKERAENLMIVDLVRNDLSMIAEIGSVSVPALFEVETYPTVHQMTSTVTAKVRPDTGLVDIFRALFPCGSVTGAPKRRTMEIIREREQSERGIYCGAIGFVSPGGEAVFSVAIRTAVLETATGNGTLGIGSGITWDSDPKAEFRECLAKSAFLTRDSAGFKLIESLLHDRNGHLLMERHLRRLEESASYFGFRVSMDSLRTRLEQLSQTLTGRHKVRILLAANGDVSLETQEISGVTDSRPLLRVAVSRQRTDSSDPFLYHKTTRRALYETELRMHPHSEEVIFMNERGEVTEGSYTNIVVSRQGELLTPALNCGLLPGVLREELIEVGAIREAVLTLDDIMSADTFWLINSVRGWREGKITDIRYSSA
jgi:para-aminobenzoate synthetase / 4-amino-4-deoxychorismate lyase